MKSAGTIKGMANPRFKSETKTLHYILKDHQGNLTATICGNAVERLNYDAWGRRRNSLSLPRKPACYGFCRFAGKENL